MYRRILQVELSPWQTAVATLGLVFVCEFAVMLVLPHIEPENPPRALTAFLDAALLITVLVPAFWWLIVRPLHKALQVRSESMVDIIDLQEEERRRLSRDLHDEVGQSFTAVLLALRSFDYRGSPEEIHARVNELGNVVERMLGGVRRLARGLRPSVLDHLGPIPAIEQMLQEMRVLNSSLSMSLSLRGLTREDRWSPRTEIAVYRILQESLTNAARHSQAKNATIDISRSGDSLTIVVTDDGRGFDELDEQRTAKKNRESLGVRGMAERVALLRGDFRIESRVGAGTRVEFRLPVGVPEKS